MGCVSRNDWGYWMFEPLDETTGWTVRLPPPMREEDGGLGRYVGYPFDD